jgi:hypothetical protein
LMISKALNDPAQMREHKTSLADLLSGPSFGGRRC